MEPGQFFTQQKVYLSYQLLQGNDVGDSVGNFAKFLVDYVCSLCIIHLSDHSITEDQVGQAGTAFHETMMASPDPPVVLHMVCDFLQDDLLQNLAKDQVVP